MLCSLDRYSSLWLSNPVNSGICSRFFSGGGPPSLAPPPRLWRGNPCFSTLSGLSSPRLGYASLGAIIRLPLAVTIISGVDNSKLKIEITKPDKTKSSILVKWKKLMHYYLRRLKIDCMIFLRKIKHHLKKYTKVINNHDFVKPLLVFQRENEAVLLLEKKSLKDEAGITVSKDGFNFSPVEETMSLPKNIPHFPKSVILPNFYYHGQKVMFFGDRSLKIAYLTKDNKWRAKANPLLTLPHPIELGNVFIRKEGLLVFYHEKKVEDKITYYASHFAFFEKKNPSKFLFKTEEPVLEHKALWSGEKAEPLGSVFLNEQIITYWHLSGKIIWAVILAGIIFDPLKIQKVKLKLKKHSRNPIITPRPENNWEAFNTFNPAALYAGGKVHILYRAQGFDYISTVGYASSRDGINIDERLSKPVFSASLDGINTQGFISNEFFSGGGLGGCEDPRLTQMRDKVYMTYVAFNYNMHPRLALTSILLEDFLNKRWHWSKPVLISPPGVIDKSGCLLPEKINQKNSSKLCFGVHLDIMFA